MSDNSIEKEIFNKDSQVQIVEEDINNYIHETRPWYRVPHLRLLAFHVFIITLTSTNNGFDGSMLNGLQSLDYWQSYMGYPTGQRLGALSAAPIFGCIAVFFFAPYFCDRFGRKFVICVGQSLTVLGAILQGVSNSYGFFFASRFIIGLGSGIATVGSPTLISEIAYPTHREVCTFAYNICWYLGALIAAIVTYFTRNIQSSYSWRIPSYLQGLLPLIQLLLFFWVPESPRFLVAKGKLDKAEDIISKVHTGNSTDQRDVDFVQFELREIQAGLEAEKAAGANASYLDFVKRKSYRKRLFLVMFTATIMQLSGNGLVSYYLNKVLNSIGITSTSKQLLINLCLMLFNLVVSFVVCCVSGFFRRRTLFITCVLGMLVCYIIWTALSAVNQQRGFKDKGLANGVLAMIFLYYLAYDIGANGLPYLYITEILPYSHRSKGINIFQFWMQVILVFNSFVNPIAMDAIEWKYYIVYCCVLAVESVIVILFYPETSGRTLEEVAEVFGDHISPAELGTANYQAKRSTEHVEHV
jgi:sugar porter (SP) family MFS transporter